MKPTTWILSLSTAALALGAAACNPSVDPNATFTATGLVVDAMGNPLAGTDVRLIKYSSDLELLEPSVETLFADSPGNDTDVGLYTSLVQSAKTDMTGRYTMTFKGSDISAHGAAADSQGLVMVATTVVVVRDPSDPEHRAGVYTLPFVYQQAAKSWDAGKLHLWAASAVADTGHAATDDLIDFTWKKIDNPPASQVGRLYRLDIGSANTARLVIHCNEGADVYSDCLTTSDGQLRRSVSAFSIYTFYADPATGMFSAYINAENADFRFVAKFTVTQPMAPDIRGTHDAVQLLGVWSVGTGPDQDLTHSKATDGDPRTREPITNMGTAIYVHLSAPSISEAGILNSVLANASKGCMVLEFNVTDYNDIATAKGSDAGAWTQKGKFCGENGGPGEVSALAGFQTKDVAGIQAAWMRVRAVADVGQTAALTFQQVGEVAVYKKK